MAKAEQALRLHTPIKLTKPERLCTCGCGETCGDGEYVWYEIDGQPFAEWECWELYANAAINWSWRYVRLEEGDMISIEDFKYEYGVIEHG